MNDKDCKRIAEDANIHFESVIDIYYNKQFKFEEENESNIKAKHKLKEFYSKESSKGLKQVRTAAKRRGSELSNAQDETRSSTCTIS